MGNEFVCSDDKEWVPDGEYMVQCFAYNNGFCFGKNPKTFLWFRIINQGEHDNKKIFMAFNTPYDKKIKTGCKYYKTWCMVNDWHKPSRNAAMSPKLFINKIYMVKTRTVIPQHNGKPMPESFKYSIVEEIISVHAG